MAHSILMIAVVHHSGGRADLHVRAKVGLVVGGLGKHTKTSTPLNGKDGLRNSNLIK
jgi:hypothetical protein